MSYLRDNPSQIYICFDCETESLSLFGKNRPWSISWLLYQNGKILEQHNRFILWEDLNMSKGAAQVTRFNYEEYRKKAEDANKVLDDFEVYLHDSKYVIIFHNGTNFDQYIIKNWHEDLGRKNDYSYLERAIDTNSLARAIKKGVKKIERKDWKLMNFRFGNYREKGLKTNLTALGKEFNIMVDYDSLHDSGADIILNIKVFDQLKYQIEI
ncbi:MAG: hypothetical protein AABY22_08060 [Nanoarchaeota archaeon]